MDEMQIIRGLKWLAVEYWPIVVAMAITIGGTHAIKVMAEHWYRAVTTTRERWRSFQMVVVLTVGTAAGTGAWLSGEHWAAVPAVAFLTPLLWLLLRALLRGRLRGALTTYTDRKYQKGP